MTAGHKFNDILIAQWGAMKAPELPIPQEQRDMKNRIFRAMHRRMLEAEIRGDDLPSMVIAAAYNQLRIESPDTATCRRDVEQAVATMRTDEDSPVSDPASSFYAGNVRPPHHSTSEEQWWADTIKNTLDENNRYEVPPFTEARVISRLTSRVNAAE